LPNKNTECDENKEFYIEDRILRYNKLFKDKNARMIVEKKYRYGVQSGG
jgi:hypothetical protein